MSEEKKDLIENIIGSPTEDDKRIQDKKRTAVAKGPDNFGMYFIGFSAGGEMPAEYKSNRYTSRVDAERVAEEFNRG
jgi:hypothetical protein